MEVTFIPNEYAAKGVVIGHPETVALVKAEAEQAAVIYWMLGLYVKHGAVWREEGSKELTAVLAAASEVGDV